MTAQDKNGQIEWKNFYLPNIPIYQSKLPNDIVNRLWSYIDNSIKNNDIGLDGLAGNISKSLMLVDDENYFMNYVINPIAQLYSSCQRSVSWIPNTHNHSSGSMVLNEFWVNFQNKHEFNPIHNHGGVLSFVVWMKIPTDYIEQHNLPICKNSNTPSASDFQFIYSDILGNHQDYRIKMSSEEEGCILIFPAQLRHQVYPFYNCDEQRVSISGNISWNSMDLNL